MRFSFLILTYNEYRITNIQNIKDPKIAALRIPSIENDTKPLKINVNVANALIMTAGRIFP